MAREHFGSSPAKFVRQNHSLAFDSDGRLVPGLESARSIPRPVQSSDSACTSAHPEHLQNSSLKALEG